MSDIDFLENDGRRFVAVCSGEDYFALPDPREMDFQGVLALLEMEHVIGTPRDIPEWQRARVFELWRASWDLPTFAHARRLAYLVDHYRGAITYDLAVYTHQDLATLWRERRWSHLLDIIDRLPGYSQYGGTVAMDEEHARMVAEALANQDERSENTGPSIIGWTPEVSLLAQVVDAVRGVQHAVVAVNAAKGKTPEAPKPIPRPTTALERALKRSEMARRQRRHDALVARVLPHKAEVKS